jgi:lipopolysaccharide/colanic/teichoic acid biosynthesis glycosyltransferase
MRRVIDVVFALVWLVLTAPLIAVIALLIRLESRGPVLYLPTMVGYQGKLFTLFRFRTLSRNESDPGPQQMFTRIGMFIRNYSLDHLPMLINVLKGDLSIIGPRPMEVQFVDLTDQKWQEYFQAKPGLINYAVLKLGKSWAVSRANKPHINQALELEYRDKQSAILDMQPIIQFFQSYVTSRGNVKARGTPDPTIEQRVKNDDL